MNIEYKAENYTRKIREKLHEEKTHTRKSTHEENSFFHFSHFTLHTTLHTNRNYEFRRPTKKRPLSFCGFWQERRVNEVNPARPREQSDGALVFARAKP